MYSGASLTLLTSLCLLVSGCNRSGAIAPASIDPPPAEHAPDVSWVQDGHEISLASMEGRTVLLHFAEAASPSWEALEEAYPDLEAEGATVLGVVTTGSLPLETPFEVTLSEELATAFGITVTPAAVVVDAEGWVRGRAHALNADAFFALAAPVLLEEPTASSPEPPSGHQLDAAGLTHLARTGAVLIDLRTDSARESEGWVPLALPCLLDALSAEQLPADLSATLIFLGPDAETASELATTWGYVSVLELTDVEPYVENGTAPSDQIEASLYPSRTVRG